MTRSVFFSFHFAKDFSRTQLVRNMGIISGNKVATPNKWEEVKRKGKISIQAWIDENMIGKSCLVVLVGSNTAGRQWIEYEIEKAWNDGKGVLGIRIHNLKDLFGKQSTSGNNPFSIFNLCGDKRKLSGVVPLKSPNSITSTGTYKIISENIEDWIEEAIEIRKSFKC